MLVSRGSWTLSPCRHFLLFLWICVAAGRSIIFISIFIWQRNTSSGRHATLSVCSLQLAVQFLFNTYFRTTRKLRSGKNHAVLFILLKFMFKQSQSVLFSRWLFIIFRIHTEEWCSCIGTIVKHNSEACSWFLNFLAGERGKGYVRYVYLLTSHTTLVTQHVSLSRNACEALLISTL